MAFIRHHGIVAIGCSLDRLGLDAKLQRCCTHQCKVTIGSDTYNNSTAWLDDLGWGTLFSTFFDCHNSIGSCAVILLVNCHAARNRLRQTQVAYDSGQVQRVYFYARISGVDYGDAQLCFDGVVGTNNDGVLFVGGDVKNFAPLKSTGR